MFYNVILSSIFATLYYKLKIALTEDTSLSLEWFIWLPSIFYLDILLFLSLIWAYESAHTHHCVSFVRKLVLGLIGIALALYLGALMAANVFLAFSGAVIDFGVVGSVGERISGFGPLLASQGGYALVFLLGFSVFFAISYHLTKSTPTIHFRRLLAVNKCKIFMCFVPLVCYMIAVIFFRPMSPWDMLSRNVLSELLDAPFRTEMQDVDCFVDSDLVYQPPIGLLNLTRQSHSDVNPLFIQPQTHQINQDFDFLRRSKNSNIKNIVWIFIESARSDVWPMDYNSKFADWVLTREAKAARNITPFFSEFHKDTFRLESATAAASYTIKAVLAGLCSISPLPIDFAMEHKYDYYKTCLPELLKTHGFDAKMYQTATLEFDHLGSVFEKTGFTCFGRENVDAGELSEFDEKPEEVNYFGYQDEILLPEIRRYVDDKVKSQTPYFLSVISNVNHHPFGTPSSWEKLNLSEDKEYNDILNSIAYVDRYFSKLMSDLKERDPNNETLYVISGDHGHSYNEHGIFGTGGVGYEEAFKIPLMLYTENKKLKPILSGHHSSAPFTNKDVLPTILDILNDKQFDPNVRIDYGYEGDSIMHEYRDRPSTSYTNPGLAAIAYREHGLKLMFVPNSCKFVVYDLLSDPEELHPINLRQNETAANWEKYAKQQLQLELLRVREAYQYVTPERVVTHPIPIVICNIAIILFLLNQFMKRKEVKYDPLEEV
ncbi:alkaline-phosphatase-like protein [Globomyces pollinis-pini]|nr:alkaline-phosphatase-like protein [Globomyces pollinis-pini]